MRVLICSLATVISTSAFAVDDLSGMQLAANLGNILASEEACGLVYNHAAIERFIDEKVEADDLEFATLLSTMTGGQEYEVEQMTASAKAAHCRQISRVAKSFKFID